MRPSRLSSLRTSPWLSRGAWTILDQGSFAGANFVVNVLLARWLAPEGYGAYTVAYTLFLLVGVVHGGLLSEPMLIFGSTRFGAQLERYMRVVLSGHARFSVAAGLLLAMGAALAWATGETVLGHALAAFAVAQTAILFQWAMRLACYVRSQARVAATSGFVYAALVVGGVAALKWTGLLNEATGIALMGVASGVSGVLIAWQLGVPLRRVRDARLVQEAVERHRQYGGWAIGTGLLEWFNGYLPFLLLPLWGGLDETGALRALYNIILPLLFIFRGFGNLIVPAFAAAIAQGTERRVIARVGTGLGVFTALFAACVWLAGPPILHFLYDGQYDAYADLMWIVALLSFSAALTNLMQPLLRAQERPEAVFVARAGAASVTATVGAAAVVVLGVAGALVSDLLSSVVEAAAMAGLVRRGPTPIEMSGGHVSASEKSGGDTERRPHVLVAAFACGPGRGSEPGIGWQLATRLAPYYDVTVVTYSGWRDRIEAELAVRPVPGLRVAYYRLPFEPERLYTGREEWGGFAEQFHYIAWTHGARRVVRRLHDATPFDAAVHASFVRYWSPSPASALVGVPFVWGPVGGGETAPASFVAEWSWKNRLRSRLRDTVRAASHWLPAVRTTARRATVAVATTRESADRMERLGARHVEVARSAMGLVQKEADRLGAVPLPPDGPLTFLFTGRLIYWKGVDIGVRAFAQACADAPDVLADARFVVLGDGPEMGPLQALAERLGAHVEFRGHVLRETALVTLGEAHVQVHPSLHDSSGYATIEAMAAGRPVVCLALGGPAEQITPEVGIAVPAVTPEQAVRDMAAAMVRLARDPDLRARMSRAARARVAELYVWEGITAALAARLGTYIGGPPSLATSDARQATGAASADEIRAADAHTE